MLTHPIICTLDQYTLKFLHSLQELQNSFVLLTDRPSHICITHLLNLVGCDDLDVFDAPFFQKTDSDHFLVTACDLKLLNNETCHADELASPVAQDLPSDLPPLY